MEKPLQYAYTKLNEDFIFKFAILQEDELMGVLYLEIPYRYKCSKRFKIDDWFIVKPYDKVGISQEKTIMARVVLRYNANCKLNQDVLKNIDNLENQKQNTPKKEFKTKIREIGKTLYEHEKEGFQHLEDVERKIRARRMKGLRSRSPLQGTADKENRSTSVLSYTLSKKKDRDLGYSQGKIKTMQFTLNDAVTPDDLYRGASKERKTGAVPSIEADRMVSRMAKEMAALREELTSTRAKLKAMEEAQMTVDNLKLTKQLDGEREELNRERALMLKTFAAKQEKQDEEKSKLLQQVQQREAEAAKKKAMYEEAMQKMDDDRAKLNDSLRAQAQKQEELEAQDQLLTKKAREIKADQEQIQQERQDLAEYAVDLDTMKDNLLRERDNIIQDKSRLTMEKEDLENQIKQLKAETSQLEKQKEKELKEMSKRKHDLDLREDRLNKQAEEIPRKKEELEKQKADLDSLKKELSKMKEEAEEQNLALWRDRNKLNKEVKEFVEDKKMMENDMKWQKEEIANMYKELDEERADLDKEREELDDYEQELENMKLDLETRETQLLNEQDGFYRVKKAFLDKMIESGQFESVTPEMKKMAKDMGIDVDEMVEEAKRLKERKEQLDHLKKENETQLQKIKSLNSKNNSRRNSRRQSLLRPQGFHNELTNMYSRKMAVQDYLGSLFDNVCTQHLVKDIEDKRKEALKAKEDLIFANKIIENIRNENKALKRDLDMLGKVVEGLKGTDGKVDIQSILGRKNQEKSVQTDLLNFDEGDAVPREMYREMEQRLKQLEQKLRKKDLQDKVGGAAQPEGEDEEINFETLDEELKK